MKVSGPGGILLDELQVRFACAADPSQASSWKASLSPDKFIGNPAAEMIDLQRSDTMVAVAVEANGNLHVANYPGSDCTQPPSVAWTTFTGSQANLAVAPPGEGGVRKGKTWLTYVDDSHMRQFAHW
jgi:hypothetical protein